MESGDVVRGRRGAVPGEGGDGERGPLWASTMAGYVLDPDSGVRVAHATSHARTGDVTPRARAEREAEQDSILAPAATRAAGAGNRARHEKADVLRTCFERDSDLRPQASAKIGLRCGPAIHLQTRLETRRAR